VAFRSPDNFIVAADLLTANRNLYEEMVSSPDALQTLLEHCRQRGRPIKYLLYLRTEKGFLLPRADLRSVVLHDPRQYPAIKPIGELHLPEPPVKVIRSGGRVLFAAWRLPVP
jgi:hypothetical protein